MGKEIIKSLHGLNLSTDYIQVGPVHPTGTVDDVILKSKSEPKYVIRENVVRDFIEMNNKLKILSKEVDAIYFGSLAQRNPISRNTIINFLNSVKQNTLIVFDINLRPLFFTKGIIVDCLKLSSILKINDKELLLPRKLLDYQFDNNEIDFLKLLIKRFKIDLICLTRGKSGSLLVTENNYFVHPGFKVKISDTVGPGDAFMAAMVIELLNGKSLRVMGESSCGKSVTALSILRILPKQAKIVGGKVLLNTVSYNGSLELTKYKQDSVEMRNIRRKEISMIFREPMTSFSPVHTIGNQILESIYYHDTQDKKLAMVH